jgi:iron complex transport system substrate-binding protein
MKKKLILLLFLLVLVISGCSNKAGNKEDNTEKDNTGTVTYESENGPIEVPADPQRIVVLSTFAGNVMELGGNIVGVDSWSKDNPRFDKELNNVEEVSDDSLEKIIELDPDLIIGLSNTKNVDKLQEIAPTVTYTYGKEDYLSQHIEIGKLLNKEEAARAWVDDFKTRAKEAGDKIKDNIGPDATISVIENFDKQLYVFGDNWGRGTEILYQEMNLKMPEKVEEMALKDGYYALQTEALPDFAGDYLVISKTKETGSSFQDTSVYKNIPAVKKDHVLEVNAMEFYFNDPITLDYQLDVFTDYFLGE